MAAISATLKAKTQKELRSLAAALVARGHVENQWRILPVDKVHDQPAALWGGNRRNAPWARGSARRSHGMNLSPSR